MSRSNITNAIFCRVHEGELVRNRCVSASFPRQRETLTCYVPCRFYWFSLGLGQRSLYYSWSSTLCRVPVAKLASNAAGYIRTVRWPRQFSLNRALFAIIKKKKRKPLSIFSPSSLAATSSRANYVFMHSGVRKYYVSFCMTFAYLDTLRAARTRLCLLKLELRYRRIDFDAFCSGGRANDKSIRSSAFSSSYDYFFFIFNREESS